MRGAVAGWHLFIDATVSNDCSELLNDCDHINDFFIDLVKILNMEILDGPRLTQVPYAEENLYNDHDDGGVSGVCLITTSHLSIHTWPLRNKFSLDAYSCKEFDCEKALDFIKDRFGVEKLSHQWHTRFWPETQEDSIAPKHT